MISKIGAAVTINNLEPLLEWLCEHSRPLEIQDFTPPNMSTEETKKVVEIYQEQLKSHNGIRGVHGPFFGLDLGNPERPLQEFISTRLLTVLDFCERLGGKYMVIHSPFTDWMKFNKLQYPMAKENAISSMAEILKLPLQRASEIGCTLVLENCDDTDPYMRMDAIQHIDHPNLKLSVDTGHAHLAHCNYRAPPVVDFITAAGENLTHVHLQDVDGYADRHWHPGEGSIPWQAVMDELHKSPSKPHLIIEVRKNMHRLPATAEFLEHLAAK
tara:strand:- start:57 stop:869 length:813 start_codon:yes stop_codon:yes gene_type:complete